MAFGSNRMSALRKLKVDAPPRLDSRHRPFVLNLLRCVATWSLRRVTLGPVVADIAPPMHSPDMDWREVDHVLTEFTALTCCKILIGGEWANAVREALEGSESTDPDMQFFPRMVANGCIRVKVLL